MTLLLFTYGCSPAYVIQAGVAELKILTSRRPITEVIRDNATPSDLRAKLTLVSEARKFASETLAMDVGTSYTTFTQLDRDTLALVLSASPKDTLEPKTWWFPIVGRFPYRGFFDEDKALAAQLALQKEGFDTYLRPTSAFSTLGWFSDPILSTVLRQNEIGLVETVLHELAHNHLFVRDQVDFNESFATFVGRTGTIEFFCTHLDSSAANLLCEQAKARQTDQKQFDRFFSGFIKDLQKIYQNNKLSFSEKLAKREEIFDQSLDYFVNTIQPNLEILSYQYFRSTPINNATLLAHIRYNTRLSEFNKLIEEWGNLRSAIAYIKNNAESRKDPFSLLEE
tara:strand:+ start:122409 stop:123425 length:1017 start_codon:yes stop_codon:yes gene_type:complete